MFALAIMLMLPAVAWSDDPSTEQLGNDLFNVIDADKDGKILPNEAVTFFLAFDMNGDKAVSYSEFTTSMSNIDSAFKGHELAIYNLLDLDRDQFVNKQDIQTVFAVADTNSDGVVTKQEFDTVFVAAMTIIG